METLRDIALSVRDWLKERVGNPFFAAFIVAWFAVNWRVVLILTGEMTAHQKISWLDQRLYPEMWHWPFFGLILPSVLALFYILVTPPMFRWVSTYHREQQHKNTIALLKADKIEPVSPERAERLIHERIRARSELKRGTARFAELESEYLDQIEKLQKQIEESQNRVKENEPEIPPADAAESTDNLKNGKVWRFSGAEFIGIGPSRLEDIKAHGLRDEDAKVLYEMRNREEFDEDDIRAATGLDRHDALTMLSRFRGLHLLNEHDNGTYSLGNVGLQVLDLLKRKGFTG
jgi:hypothetical protein